MNATQSSAPHFSQLKESQSLAESSDLAPPPYQERPVKEALEKKTQEVAVQTFKSIAEECKSHSKEDNKVSEECQNLLDEPNIPPAIFRCSYETPDEWDDLSEAEQAEINLAKEKAPREDEEAAQNDALFDIALRKRDLQTVYRTAYHGTPEHIEETLSFVRDVLAILEKVDLEELEYQRQRRLEELNNAYYD